MQSIRDPKTEFETLLSKLAPESADTYRRAITYYMQTMGLKSYDELIHQDRAIMQNTIKDFYKTCTRAKANKVTSALRKFYNANDIVINWDHVAEFKPPVPDTIENDRPYTKQEVRTLIDNAPNDRVRLAIMIMASAGPRVGALPDIRIKDLTYLEKYGLYALAVYPSTRSQYLTFCTPQTSELIARFVGNRAAERPLLYNIYEPDLPATKNTHVVSIWRLLVKIGLRTPESSEKKQEVHIDHGFRKTFRTALDIGGIREDYAERLTGHGKKLVLTYSKPEAEHWLELSGYLNAVKALTF